MENEEIAVPTVIFENAHVFIVNGNRYESGWSIDHAFRQGLIEGSPIYSHDEAVRLSRGQRLSRAQWQSQYASRNGEPPTEWYVIGNYASMNFHCPNCDALGWRRYNHMDLIHCEFCCNHYRCGDCDGDGWMYSDAACDRCGYCENHCNCIEYECGCLHSGTYYQCEGCLSCQDHCTCQRPVFVGDGHGEPFFHDAYEFESNPSKRFVAAEVELARAQDYRAIANTVREWGGAIVHDGSLPRGGIEINTAPANGDKFVEQMDELGRTLNNAYAEVTDVCGVHVHIDARDFDYAELRKLVLIYAKLEDTLFNMVPDERRNNSYCERCADKLMVVENYHTGRDIKMALVGSVYEMEVDIAGTPHRTRRYYDPISESQVDDHIQQMKHDKYNSARYSALNLHSWFYRGTVECRLFNGTTDMNDVKHWAMMWADILDYAKSAADSEIEDLGSDKHALFAITKSDETRNWIEDRVSMFATSRRYR